MRLNDDDSILIVNRISKLFSYMKEKFGNLFEDVDLQFTFGPKMQQTSLYFSFIEDSAVIHFNVNELSNINKHRKSPEIYEELITRGIDLDGVDPYFSYHENALLHELGHYLDFMTSTQEQFDIGIFEQEYIWYYLNRTKYDNRLTNAEMHNLYRQLPLEVIADKYAVEMSKTISKEMDEFYAFEDYEHMEKAKTLRERFAEALEDL